MQRRRNAGLLAGLALLAAGSPFLVAQHRSNVAEEFLLAAANQDREQHGLGPLTLNRQLAGAALYHAEEMAGRGSISHQFAGEPDLAHRGKTAGAHFSLITENVAEAPDASKINDLWMASAGHRANLLDPKVDSVGIAVILDRGEFYAVEDFARSVASLSLDQQEDQVKLLLAGTGIEVQTATAIARRTCSMQRGYAGSRQPWFVMRFTTSDLIRLPAELSEKLATGKYHTAIVGACSIGRDGSFTGYSIAVMLYP